MVGRPNRDHRLTFFQNFACGGIAGIASRSLTSPLDVVKILAQVGTKDTKRGFLRTFPNLYRNEGIRAFWKGNLMGCIRLFPFSAVQFAAFNYFRERLQDNYGRLSTPDALIAGTLGGAVAIVVTYPTDMVKTRLIVQRIHPTEGRHYRGIVHAFKTIFRQEGFFAFYRGMWTSLMGTIPFAATYFWAYEILQEAVWQKPRYMLSPTENFFNGCIAAAFAQTASYPFDTIRKKLQAQSRVLTGGGGTDVKFYGMIAGFRVVFQKYGIVGLWRGLTANLLKVVPYHGFMFVTFEGMRRFYLYENGYTVSMTKDTPKPGIDQSLRPDELKSFSARSVE
ncbi:solute carrier family 25 member 43-like [Ptychodera flava]|uniref:solute carrier family 25 member 43-like n=1 Tax=Ptychodera flava TaxID=63121 RepID=UPI003969F0F6